MLAAAEEIIRDRYFLVVGDLIAQFAETIEELCFTEAISLCDHIAICIFERAGLVVHAAYYIAEFLDGAMQGLRQAITNAVLLLWAMFPSMLIRVSPLMAFVPDGFLVMKLMMPPPEPFP